MPNPQLTTVLARHLPRPERVQPLLDDEERGRDPPLVWRAQQQRRQLSMPGIFPDYPAPNRPQRARQAWDHCGRLSAETHHYLGWGVKS